MHGIIFSELKNYYNQHFDPNSWQEFLKEIGIGFKHYLPIQDYPDQEMKIIIEKIAELQSKTTTNLLIDFGQFIVPSLLNMYKSLIKPEWRTLDLIERTENTIHTVVRLENQGASPPSLQCDRINDNEVEVIYNSERKLCSVAKGIIRGIAKHFDEKITITEDKCMIRGDSACRMKVSLKN